MDIAHHVRPLLPQLAQLLSGMARSRDERQAAAVDATLLRLLAVYPQLGTNIRQHFAAAPASPVQRLLAATTASRTDAALLTQLRADMTTLEGEKRQLAACTSAHHLVFTSPTSAALDWP